MRAPAAGLASAAALVCRSGPAGRPSVWRATRSLIWRPIKIPAADTSRWLVIGRKLGPAVIMNKKRWFVHSFVCSPTHSLVGSHATRPLRTLLTGSGAPRAGGKEVRALHSTRTAGPATPLICIYHLLPGRASFLLSLEGSNYGRHWRPSDCLAVGVVVVGSKTI